MHVTRRYVCMCMLKVESEADLDWRGYEWGNVRKGMIMFPLLIFISCLHGGICWRYASWMLDKNAFTPNAVERPRISQVVCTK